MVRKGRDKLRDMDILKTKEKKTQVYFRDDNKFKFIKRELEYSCLVEKSKGVLVRAWKHFFGNQYYFPGYKNISADTVTLGGNRDIILDPFNKVPTGEEVSNKPDVTGKGLKRWIAKIASNQRHIYRTERKSTVKEDMINWSLIGVLVMMVGMWAISFMKGMY